MRRLRTRAAEPAHEMTPLQRILIVDDGARETDAALSAELAELGYASVTASLEATDEVLALIPTPKAIVLQVPRGAAAGRGRARFSRWCGEGAGEALGCIVARADRWQLPADLGPPPVEAQGLGSDVARPGRIPELFFRVVESTPLTTRRPMRPLATRKISRGDVYVRLG